MEKIIPPIIEMKDHDDKEATPVFRALIKDILAIPCGKGWNQNLKKEARLLKIQENDDDSMNDDEEDENAAEKIRKSLIQIATTVITNLDFVQNECLDVLFYHIINPQRVSFVELNRELALKTKNSPRIFKFMNMSLEIGRKF